MKRMKATIMSGISASGKSTAALEITRKTGAVEVNRDNIRKTLVENDGGIFVWDKWNWKREGEVTKIAEEMMRSAAEAGKDLVISDTNLNADRRAAIEAELSDMGYDVEIVVINVPIETAWKRDAARCNGVGHSVIAAQHEQFLKLVGRKKYVADKSKPKCILVDIDGTLAHMNGKRGAFDWAQVGVDEVDPYVKLVVNAVTDYSGVDVIVLSGRDGVCRPETEKWLKDNTIFHDRLIMRAPGDMRKDTVVKEEIFWRDIADNYDVQFVIDDRPSVCRMWREVDVKTFQVGNPHIEF